MITFEGLYVVLDYIQSTCVDDNPLVFARNGEIKVYIDMSDIFGYATADMEEVSICDLTELRQAVEDIKAIGGRSWCAGVLYAARKRNTRPIQVPSKLLPLYENLPANRNAPFPEVI